MISEIIAGLIAIIAENCTGVIILRKCDVHDDPESSLIQLEIEETLHEFRRFDQNDVIFREYDPPADQEEDPKAWKNNVPSAKESILKSIGSVFVIQTVCGMCIGLLAIIFVWIQMNTMFVCYFQYYHVPKKIFAIKMFAHGIQGFLVELYHYFVLATVFSWEQLKSLHIPFISVIVGLIDIVYEVTLFLAGFAATSWKDFPLYILFTVMIVTNSTILARHYRPWPSKWTKTMALSFTFCAQFFFGSSLIVFYCYLFWPWYNTQTEYTKIITAACSPLITFFPKLICRLAAQKLREVHPGSAHVFVVVLYGTCAVVFRVMQAEFASFISFFILGVIHGFLDLLERLTAIMRDHIWGYLYRFLRCKRKRMCKYRSPRSRRFVADMSIQILLQEGAGLVVSLGIIHLYQFIYSNTKPPYTDYTVLADFCIRVFTGLSIDLFFNTISVVLQTRYMNIAVMKVWSKKWKHHCLVLVIVTIETMLFFTGYLLNIIQYKYDYEKHPVVRYAWNCSMPFSDL